MIWVLAHATAGTTGVLPHNRLTIPLDLFCNTDSVIRSSSIFTRDWRKTTDNVPINLINARVSYRQNIRSGKFCM